MTGAQPAHVPQIHAAHPTNERKGSPGQPESLTQSSSKNVLPFIVTGTYSKLSLSDRKIICSHVTRSKPRRKRGSTMRKPCVGSWIKADDISDDPDRSRSQTPSDGTTGSNSSWGNARNYTGLGLVTHAAGFALSSPLGAGSCQRQVSYVSGVKPDMLEQIFKRKHNTWILK
jgi:hypothetical protein